MKLNQQTNTDKIFQRFLDTYGYLIGAVAMIAGFTLIGYLIIQ